MKHRAKPVHQMPGLDQDQIARIAAYRAAGSFQRGLYPQFPRRRPDNESRMQEHRDLLARQKFRRKSRSG